MNDCLALLFSGGGGAGSAAREEKVTARLAAEIDTRRNDMRHAEISVGVAKAAVADAYRDQGRTSQAFLLAVTKLRREQMRQKTCSSVLSRLEDAQHMTAMRDMTISALTALKGTNLETNDFESLYSSADDHAAIAEEAKEQVAEIATCFSNSGGDTDIDALLVELGLEAVAAAAPAAAAEVIQAAPVAPHGLPSAVNANANVNVDVDVDAGADVAEGLPDPQVGLSPI